MKFTKERYLRVISAAFGVLALTAFISFQGCSKRKYEVKDVKLENRFDSMSYSIGLLIAQNYKDQKHWDGMNMNAFKEGLMEAMQNDTSGTLTDEDARAVLEKFNKVMATRYVAGIMEENKTKEGVNVTPSGLQYKVVSEGEGDVPQIGDSIEIHYEMNIYGEPTKWSTRQAGRPIKLLYSNKMVMDGVDEAIGLMKPGSEWELMIPPKLAAGEDGDPRQQIPPYSIMEVQLTLIQVHKNN